MKEIKLTQGKTCQVDDADFEWLNKFKWHYQNLSTNNKYAKNSKLGYLHRFIFQNDIPDNFFIDHIDGNGLNCKRNNLRFCDKKQNQCNRKSSKNGTSKYLGVSLHRKKYWRAGISNNNKKKHIGLFKTEVDAALKYNEFAKIYHGEFARLNIIN